MLNFESYGLKSGTWSGLLTAANAPERVYLAYYGEPVAAAKLSPAGVGQWDVSVELPVSVLSDGIQSLLLVADSGAEGDAPQADAQHLGHLNLMAGASLDDDIMAEVRLLRAEIDMIKREFRRLASFE